MLGFLTEQSFTDGGLPSNTEFCYQVAAVNWAGQ